MIKIDKNFKLPKKQSGRLPIYPWVSMRVGDSFFLKNKRLQTIRNSACQTGKRLGLKFSCRAMDGGIRVWRVK